MGFNDDDEFHSTNVNSGKFKLPKKIFSDSNTSIPRKLRSAIRKRSSESTSGRFLDAKKSNNKQNGCLVTISKDEEEVAETLFALAGMIPLNRIGVDDKTENESLGSKASNLSAKQNSDPTPSSEGPMIPKEESEATNPTPTTNELPKDAPIDSAPFVWPKLSERRQLNLDFKVSVPPVHFQIPPLLRACDDRQLTNSNFGGSTEKIQESRFNETGREQYQLPMRESQINVADLAVSQDRQHATSTHCRDRDLTSRPLHGSGFDRLPVQSSYMSFPSRIDNTSSSKMSVCEDTPSSGKAFGALNVGRKKSWKRCIAHVYISRLIQVLQQGKDTEPSDSIQLSPSQQSSTGEAVINRDDRNGTLAGGQLLGSDAKDVQVNLKSGRVEEGAPTFSGCFDSKNQSYNFLSLSTGAGPEEKSGLNRLGITLETKGQEHLDSVAHRNNYMPNSMPQNRFPSVSYRDQVGVSAPPSSMPPQVHLQVPPYFSNPCGPGLMGTARSTQLPQSQQQQQQQIWTAQLAAQFRPGPLLSSSIANWQNSTRDPRMMNHMQAHLPPPRPSLETIGTKYHISQQQQQQLLGHRPSLPTSNAKLQSSQLPSVREDKGGQFHPDGVLPVQLLCNERILS